MTITKCDCCKKETDDVGRICYITTQLHEKSAEYWRDKKGKPANMQGTRAGNEEYCEDCFRKICWAIGNVRSGKYEPTNPVEDADLPPQLTGEQ